MGVVAWLEPLKRYDLSYWYEMYFQLLKLDQVTCVRFAVWCVTLAEGNVLESELCLGVVGRWLDGRASPSECRAAWYACSHLPNSYAAAWAAKAAWAASPVEWASAASLAAETAAEDLEARGSPGLRDVDWYFRRLVGASDPIP